MSERVFFTTIAREAADAASEAASEVASQVSAHSHMLP